MSDKIELGMLCGVLQSNFSRLSQSESRTQPCHVRICDIAARDETTTCGCRTHTEVAACG